ncbi:VC0807 family protein [Bdellovibrio sp. HCB290]|uniref:VC0807 family protein n=1 Tax=Bdellovibrio sp. HCB290 TaxID=3394356 RepID=UPI0039B4C4E4
MTDTKAQTKPENSWLNLIFNILLPVLILNKLTKHIGPGYALILALAFPLIYGIYDLIKRRKVNAFSILGLLNVGLTGGLAFVGIHGFWFAVKEAAFPALVGIFVFGSAFTKKPFIESLFLNPNVMKVDLLEQKLAEHGKKTEFHEHMRKSTMLLSLSFVLSAVLNFVLARSIFLDIDTSLTAEAQSIILNEQIAKMTTWSMAIIMVPSMIFLLGIFWYLMNGVKKHSGLTTEELMNS